MPLFAILLTTATLQTGAIHGWVRTADSLEPVPFAAVQVEDGPTVLTDAYGYYVVRGLQAGPVRLRVGSVGYGTADSTVVVREGVRSQVDFVLSTEPVRLSGIHVLHEAETAAAVTPGPPPVRVDARMFDLVPALAEKDAFRALQILPSVAAASDFSSALYIRGGAPDQSSVLLDGAPLFNPYHVGGLFSAIDPDAISAIEVLPGGMPAAAPDAASGVVQMWTRDGGRDRIRGSGGLGLVSSRLGLDGPLPTEGGSFLVSARRTYVDAATGAAHRLGLLDTWLPYAFTDVHGKITQRIGSTGRLNISGYVNDEHVRSPPDFTTRTRFAWGTRAGSVAYRQPFGPSLLGEATLAATSFDGTFTVVDDLSSDAVPADTSLVGRAIMRDLVADAGLTWYGAGHRVKAGVRVDAYDFDYHFVVGDVVLTGPTGGSDDEVADFFASLGRAAGITTLAVYLEDEWTVSDAVAVRAGLRALHAAGFDTEVMPRLGLRWTLDDGLTLSAAAGRYAQAIHSLRNEESLVSSIIPYELLVSTSAATGFLVAEDVTLGLEYRRPATRIRVDGYVKRYPTLPTAPLATDPLDAPIFADEFRPGTGRGAGLELLAQRSWRRSSVTLSYALAWAERRLDEDRYRPRYHRLHVADLTAALGLGENATLTSRLSIASGQPYTPAVGRSTRFVRDPVTGRYRPLYPQMVLGGHNSERLPAYVRLDLGVRNETTRHWFGREVTLTPYFQVLNILGIENVVAGQPEFDPLAGGRLVYVPGLPFLPTFGVEWRF